MGKSADDLVGFNYPAGGSDSDIGVYKQPETVQVAAEVYERGETLSSLNISAGNNTKNAFKPENPFGSKEMRGYGAATKGRKISGKQG